MEQFFQKTFVRSLLVASATCCFVLSCLIFISDHSLARIQKPYEELHRAKLLDQTYPVYVPHSPDIPGLRRISHLNPIYSPSYYETGKALHRLLVSERIEGKELVRETYQMADAAYRRAVLTNNVCAQARFWRAMLHAWAADGNIPGTGAEGRVEHYEIADSCFRSALVQQPFNRDFLYHAGTFWLQHGQIDDALDAFERNMKISTGRLPEIVEQLWDLEEGPNLLEEIVPDNPMGHLEYSEALLTRNEPEVAFVHWKTAMGMNGKDIQTDASPAGVVHNGGFEEEFGSFFHDWSFQPIDGVSVRRDETDCAEKQYCLLLDFDRARSDYFHGAQDVPLAPLTKYRLSAMVRTKGVNTGERLGLEVLGGEDRRVLCEASASPGEAWQLVECVFQVPFGVWKVQLRVRRFATIGVEGTAKVWIDDVRLTEELAEENL